MKFSVAYARDNRLVFVTEQTAEDVVLLVGSIANTAGVVKLAQWGEQWLPNLLDGMRNGQHVPLFEQFLIIRSE